MGNPLYGIDASRFLAWRRRRWCYRRWTIHRAAAEASTRSVPRQTLHRRCLRRGGWLSWARRRSARRRTTPAASPGRERFPDGGCIDLGVQWVWPTHYALIGETGGETYPTPELGKALMPPGRKERAGEVAVTMLLAFPTPTRSRRCPSASRTQGGFAAFVIRAAIALAWAPYIRLAPKRQPSGRPISRSGEPAADEVKKSCAQHQLTVARLPQAPSPYRAGKSGSALCCPARRNSEALPRKARSRASRSPAPRPGSPRNGRR